MKSVSIRGTAFGEGRTKIIAPLTAAEPGALEREAAALRALPADAAEWRADSFAHLADPAAVSAALAALRRALGPLPLLFTVRTANEGGSAQIPLPTYCECTCLAAASGCVDLVDTEVFAFDDPAEAARHIRLLQSCGVRVVASRHFFDRTPTEEEMLVLLRRLRESGADLVKLAVMPHSRADVLSLLTASARAHAELDCPVITISMGARGVFSRIACSLSGSCASFAAGSAASAPGQLPAAELRRLLDLLEDDETA